MKRNVIRFITNLKHSIYETKHGMYIGSDLEKEINLFKKEERRLKSKIDHYVLCNNLDDDEKLQKAQHEFSKLIIKK